LLYAVRRLRVRTQLIRVCILLGILLLAWALLRLLSKNIKTVKLRRLL
jgi:hypothetical protein